MRPIRLSIWLASLKPHQSPPERVLNGTGGSTWATACSSKRLRQKLMWASRGDAARRGYGHESKFLYSEVLAAEEEADRPPGASGRRTVRAARSRGGWDDAAGGLQAVTGNRSGSAGSALRSSCLRFRVFLVRCVSRV